MIFRKPMQQFDAKQQKWSTWEGHKTIDSEGQEVKGKSLCSSSSHPLFILWHNLTYHLDLVLSASQPHWYRTRCLSVITHLSHFLLSNITSILTFSSQPNRQPPSNQSSNTSWFFNRLWCYINHLLTYLQLASLRMQQTNGMAMLNAHTPIGQGHYIYVTQAGKSSIETWLSLQSGHTTQHTTALMSNIHM